MYGLFNLYRIIFMTEIKKPQASNSSAQKELDKAEKQFDSFVDS
jgi:hypothetical protein